MWNDAAPIVEDEGPDESLKFLRRRGQALCGPGDGFRGLGRLMGCGLDRIGGLDDIMIGVRDVLHRRRHLLESGGLFLGRP